MANQIDVYQSHSQVEFDDPPLMKSTQVIAQVELTPNPEGMYVYQNIVQVEWEEFVSFRIFPVPPQQRQLQSQAGKRTFPVVI